MTDRKPWQRRDNESSQAYAAFALYYQLPTHERSIDAAWQGSAEQQRKKRVQKVAPRHWYGWSSDNDWVKRATAYDDHLIEQDRLLWEKRRRDLLERDWAQADKLRAVVDEAIPHANLFVRRKTTVVKGDAAHGIPDREVVTMEFDITSLATVLEKASKLQRLATDEPTENVNLSGAALDAAIARELAKLADSGEEATAGALATGESNDDGVSVGRDEEMQK